MRGNVCFLYASIIEQIILCPDFLLHSSNNFSWYFMSFSKVMFNNYILFQLNLYWNFSTTIILPWDTSDYFSLTYNIEMNIAMHKAFLIQIIYEDTFIIVNSYLKQHEYLRHMICISKLLWKQTLYSLHIYSAVVYIIDYHVFLFW